MSTIQRQAYDVLWACIAWTIAILLGLLSQAATDGETAILLAYAAAGVALTPPLVWFMRLAWNWLDEGDEDADLTPVHPRTYRCDLCHKHLNVLQLDPAALRAHQFRCRACAGTHEREAA